MDLNLRQQAILSNEATYCSLVSHELECQIKMIIFDTGIGVFIIFDKEELYPDDPLFVIDYLTKRKQCHASILNWNHPASFLLNKTLEDLRSLVNKYHKDTRPTSRENGGLSYVMSISFITSSNFSDHYALRWDLFPESLKKAIPAILNPSILSMEDSLLLPNENQVNREYILSCLENINEQPKDYEIRIHIMTFMSWAAVLVVGNCNELEKDDYIFLEIELQHYWYYLYCLETSLPIRDLKLETEKLSLEQVMRQRFELELIEENLKFIDDSSIPERYTPIIEGLIQTSRIHELFNRYRRKLDYCREILLLRQQSKQRLLSQTSEILLFLVAYLQIAPILYNFIFNLFEMDDLLKTYVSMVFLILLFILGSVILVFKNKFTR